MPWAHMQGLVMWSYRKTLTPNIMKGEQVEPKVTASVCVDFLESNVFGEHQIFYNWGGFSSDWDDSQVISVSWDGYKQHDAFSTSSWAGINQVIWWHPSGTESLLLYSLSPVWAASCQRFWIIHSAHVDFPADSKISLSLSPLHFWWKNSSSVKLCSLLGVKTL